MDNVSAIILTAGKGTRMNAEGVNKGMLDMGGKPMISHTVENIRHAGITSIIMVVGYAKESIMDFFKNTVQYAVQEKQLGTAHALAQGLKVVPPSDQTIVSVYGDDSYAYPPTLYQKMVETHHQKKADVTLLTVFVDEPVGLGRVLRDAAHHVVDIIEDKDATVEQKRIHEINTGCYVFKKSFIEELLPYISNQNAAGEYYLTDIIRLAVKKGSVVADVRETSLQWRGINRPEELNEARKFTQ